MKHMTSNSSYLLRAYYDWISDNLLTPYMVVDTTVADVHVPSEYIENDKIVLNILSSAVKSFDITPEAVSFQARFAGVVYDIWLPIKSICSIYAQENGVGFLLGNDFEPTGLSIDIDDLEQNELESSFQVSSLEVIEAKEPCSSAEKSNLSTSDRASKKKTKAHLKVIK